MRKITSSWNRPFSHQGFLGTVYVYIGGRKKKKKRKLTWMGFSFFDVKVSLC